MVIPGFGSEELRPYKKSVATEAHKQVCAYLFKSTMSARQILVISVP